jgi:ribosome-associated protein
MPRKPLKKSSPKKSVKAVSKNQKPASRATAKKPAAAPDDKERAMRAANLIANSEKKKKPARRKSGKAVSEEVTKHLLDAVVDGMQEKKAKRIMVLNLKGIENRVADYFVICDADSRTHVNSIADSVEEVVEKKSKEKAYHTEGHHNGEWILLDYINVVAHVFLREMREHYNLEGLWGDAEISAIAD